MTKIGQPGRAATLRAGSGARAVIYARVSNDRDGRMTSVEQQLAECQREAKRRGLQVVCELYDNDISAFTGKPRPAYDELLRMIRDGEVDAVIVWEQSRLTRRPLELEEYVGACESVARSIPTYIVVDGDLKLDTPNGRMVARIKGAVNRQEVEQLIERTKRGLRARAANGEPVGGRRPFGFEGDKITHRPAEAAAIVEATSAILAGESVQGIARMWRNRGITTSTGGTCTTAQVRAILKRPRNAGLILHAQEIIGQAVWEPIVPIETWSACVALLADPARKVSPGSQPAYLGSYIFQCGAVLPSGDECGAPMQTGRSGKYATRVYRCPASRQKVDDKIVPHVTISTKLADEYVGDYLVRALDFAGFGIPRGPEVSDPTSEIDELEDLERKQSILTQQWITNVITDSDYEQATALLLARRARATASLAKAVPVRRIADELSDVAGELEVWNGLSLTRQRAIVNEIATVTILPRGSGPKGPIGDRIRIALDLSEWEDVTTDIG